MSTRSQKRPDPRAIALRILSEYLTAGGLKPLVDRAPMPAPPRMPAGGVVFPRAGRTPPIAAPRPTPPVPFPALPPAAAAHARPSAMEVIARFVEAARARGGRA